MTVLKQKGFTLIEILIAIFILTIVLSTIYAAYTGTHRIVKDTEYGNDIYSMARTTMQRMVADLESVCKYNGSFKFTSLRKEINGQEFTMLTFLSSAHLSFDDDNSSGIASISYYFEEDSENKGYLLLRKDTLNKTEEEGETTTGQGFILCDRLYSLKYKFYDSKGEEYNSWDSASDLGVQKDKAPSVVSIHLDFINPDNSDNPYKFTTKAFLPMAGN
jgi:general secretion pathway protein J